jgi:hypothetical protein
VVWTTNLLLIRMPTPFVISSFNWCCLLLPSHSCNALLKAIFYAHRVSFSGVTPARRVVVTFKITCFAAIVEWVRLSCEI